MSVASQHKTDADVYQAQFSRVWSSRGGSHEFANSDEGGWATARNAKSIIIRTRRRSHIQKQTQTHIPIRTTVHVESAKHWNTQPHTDTHTNIYALYMRGAPALLCVFWGKGGSVGCLVSGCDVANRDKVQIRMFVSLCVCVF